MRHNSSIFDSKNPPESTTLLEHKETTLPSTIPSTFQAYRRRFCESEWLAAETIYELFPGVSRETRLFRFRECRTWAWFTREIETGLVRIASSNCKLRWCPLCANAKQNYIFRNCQDWLRHSRQPKMLTLTLKHSNAPLKEQIDHLYKCFQYLRKKKLFRDNCYGGIWFFQIKRSDSDGLWHPHLHCLISSEYIPQHLLSHLWYQITLTSDIVDIRSIRDNEKAAKEVSRYCARPCRLSELTNDDMVTMFETFHGRRISGTWGSGRKCSLRPEKNFDKSKFEYLGSWRTIRENLSFDDRAKAILHAYKTNKSLAPDINFRNTENTDEQEVATGLYDHDLEVILNKSAWDP